MPMRNRRQLTLLLLVGSTVALLFCGCVSSSASPPNLLPTACALDPRLPGTWKSTRSSPLGPASMRFSFECDCTYESRARIFLMSIRESGSYAVEGGQISFSRASGEVTTWPFRFSGEQILILLESPVESHSYRRVKPRKCPNVTGPS